MGAAATWILWLLNTFYRINLFFFKLINFSDKFKNIIESLSEHCWGLYLATSIGFNGKCLPLSHVMLRNSIMYIHTSTSYNSKNIAPSGTI